VSVDGRFSTGWSNDLKAIDLMFGGKLEVLATFVRNCGLYSLKS
jgi:hypothetical protein